MADENAMLLLGIPIPSSDPAFLAIVGIHVTAPVITAARPNRTHLRLALSGRSCVRQSGEKLPQILLCFKADTGDLRRGRNTVGNDRVVAESIHGRSRSV